MPSRCSVRPAIAALALLVVVACSRPRAPSSPAPSRANTAESVALRDKSLMVPVEGVAPAKLRDSYGAARGEQIHAALDIMAPRGTPVVAADAGRILRLRQNAAGGTTIYQLDASERFVYYYAHLDRYRRGLVEGMQVRQGDVLGYVGTTGNAPPETPHLHFQLMRYRGGGQYSGGEPIDPLPYLRREGKSQR